MADPTIFSFTLRDTNGVSTSTRAYAIYNGATTTVNSLIGIWLALGGLIDDASNAQIIAGGVDIPLIPDATWKTAPVEENDVSDVITLNYGNDITSKLWGFLLPNFKDSMITTGGQVDLTQADLAALITGLETTFATGQYSNANGQNLTDLVNAFQSDRKHRRQIVSRSKVFPS